MNRDKVLYTVIGLLAGFICGYVMHEVMAARQPAPGWASTSGRPATAGGAPRANPAASGAAAASGSAGSQPAMEQVQRLAAYVRENPEDASAIRQLADLNYDISNWQRAAELYSRYLELDATDVDVMTDLGATYRHLSRPQDALEQFRNARELAPDNWQARYNEVLVLAFDLNDLPGADAAMGELVSMQPDNPQVAHLAEELKKRSQGA